MMALSFLLLLATHAVAQNSVPFTVSPMSSQLKMPRADARVTDEVIVYNQGDGPAHISVDVGDWTLDPSGEYVYSDAGTNPRSCAKWIQINPPQFVVQPKQHVRVRYTISPPADLKQEHWAMLFFRSRPLAYETSDKISFRIITRVACKVSVLPSIPLEKQGRVLDVSIPEGNATEGIVSFENTGAINTRISGKVSVLDTAGAVVAVGDIGKSVPVLSESERLVKVVWNKPLAPGHYKLQAVIDYGAKALAGFASEADVTEAKPKAAESVDPAKAEPTSTEQPTLAPVGPAATNTTEPDNRPANIKGIQ
ncbi:MAG TPA: hypothetical protein VF681_15965 [Abditibacteriaceae bacterium]|jgi:P pilus assembly chaperone PapD